MNTSTPNPTRKLLVLLILSLLVSLLIGSASAQRTLRLSYIDPQGGAWDQGAKRFAELVAERSDGQLIIETYPGSILANRNQQAEAQAVQTGTIDAVLISPIILALFIEPRFDMFSLPFLFPDLEVALATTDALKSTVDPWFEERGLHAVAIGGNGFRQVTNSERPIRSPEDMRGLRFRVAGTRLFLETFAQLGTSAITMNFGEVFTALQQGVIDGQENPLNIIESARLFEVQNHVTLWNYVFDPIFLTFNGQVWASLSPEEQEILTEAGLEAMAYQREVIFEAVERLPEELAEQGMEVYRPTPEELEAFRSAVEGVYSHPEIVGRIGADNIEMIVERVAAVREELGR